MTLAAFLSIAVIHLLAAMSPGPSFVVALRTAAAEGFATATALAFGFGLGALLWAGAAMTGVAVLFDLIPQLFLALKIVGGLFLIWIALMMWRHAKEPVALPESAATPRSPLSAVRYGFLTFAANPKPAVFFAAVFAGLLPPDLPVTWGLAILCTVFVNETLWYILVARVFSLPRPRAAYLRFKAAIDRAFGGLIGFFGAKIALT